MILEIKNITNKKQTIGLLDLLSSAEMDSNPVVDIHVSNPDMSYADLLKGLIVDPVLIQFVSSSNNRQLRFVKRSITYHRDSPILPTLWVRKGNIVPMPTKRVAHYEIVCFDEENGEPVYSKTPSYKNVPRYYPDPARINIVDTQEPCLWRLQNLIRLFLKPNQTFKIELLFLPKPHLIKYDTCNRKLGRAGQR